MADVIPIFKKDDPFEKANYRPISLLPSLSKVYEILIYQQLNAFLENKLSLLCGFRSRYSTQHALLNLINKWHSCLDNSGVVGTTLMDLSKAFDCLPHELALAKLHAYGVDIKNLKLLQDYLQPNTKRQTCFYLQLMVEDSPRSTTSFYPWSITFQYFLK